ncbi:MAG: hypothetical protein R2939_16435 [Kofleriaceae bacterium]
MKLNIRFRQIVATPELREQLARRVRLTLARLGHEVRVVDVTLADINGPRGGRDTLCRVRLRGPRVGALVVEDVGVDVGSTIGGVLDRAARAAVRALDRRRSWAPMTAVA